MEATCFGDCSCVQCYNPPRRWDYHLSEFIFIHKNRLYFVADGSCNSMLLPSLRREHHSAYCWDHVKIKIQNLISISTECASLSHCHNFTPSKNSKLNHFKSEMSVIKQYADFSEWFISLSIIQLRFLNVF